MIFMQTVTMCRSEEFCLYCKETGGEYGVPVVYYCQGWPCHTKDKPCLFVQAGGKRV